MTAPGGRQRGAAQRLVAPGVPAVICQLGPSTMGDVGSRIVST